LSVLGLAAAAPAADRFVATAGTDIGSCRDPVTPCASIQYAVDQSADGDTIHVAAGTYVENVQVYKSVSIVGAGSASTIVDGAASGSVFWIGPREEPWERRVELVGLSVTNGDYQIGSGIHVVNPGITYVVDCDIHDNLSSYGVMHFPGGAVYNDRSELVLLRSAVRRNDFEGNWECGGGPGIYSHLGRLTLVSSIVEQNTVTGGGWCRFGGGVLIGGGDATIIDSLIRDNRDVQTGGGVDAAGSVRMINCTVSGNSAQEDGGGVHVSAGGEVELHNCTVIGNSAAESGGGLCQASGSGSVAISDSIVYGNTSPAGPDCWGEFVSGGHNLIGDTSGCTLTGDLTGNLVGVDPLLGPLQDNGGPTFTHALLPGSPAIDAGDPAGCLPATDQRGEPRHRDGDCDGDFRCDMGAFELEGCGSPELRVYESTDAAVVVDPANDVGPAQPSPHDHAPAADPVLFYQIDDGFGFPGVIELTKGGLGLLIYY
jgi:hypothetical protein